MYSAMAVAYTDRITQNREELKRRLRTRKREEMKRMEVIGEFICQHIGALIVLVPAFLYLAVLSWKYYQECKFDSMWDGKPWDEAEYQRRVKEWEAELEKKRESE